MTDKKIPAEKILEEFNEQIQGTPWHHRVLQLIEFSYEKGRAAGFAEGVEKAAEIYESKGPKYLSEADIKRIRKIRSLRDDE